MKKKYILKTILIGDQNVGKSNIIRRLCDDEFDNTTMPTIGIDFYSKTYNIDDIHLKFHIWDTSGNSRYRSIVDAYYKTINIVIICYDVSDRHTFENVRNWYKQIQNLNIDSSLIYIIGNKIDVDYVEVSIYELRDLADELGTSYLEISAKENTNIDRLFEILCTNFLKSDLRNIKDNSIVLSKTLPSTPPVKYCNLC